MQAVGVLEVAEQTLHGLYQLNLVETPFFSVGLFPLLYLAPESHPAVPPQEGRLRYAPFLL